MDFDVNGLIAACCWSAFVAWIGYRACLEAQKEREKQFHVSSIVWASGHGFEPGSVKSFGSDEEDEYERARR